MWTEGSGGTTLLLYFAFALVHDSRGIEIANFTISHALSAGTLVASAGTPYRLVPAAHFYPWLQLRNNRHSDLAKLQVRSWLSRALSAPGQHRTHCYKTKEVRRAGPVVTWARATNERVVQLWVKIRSGQVSL